MEALYLFCSIISTCLTSLALSILLLFRSFLRRFLSVRPNVSTSEDVTAAVSLYEGTVWHERRRPVRHSFKYTVRYALIDLDHAPHSLQDHFHFSAGEARRVAETNGPVWCDESVSSCPFLNLLQFQMQTFLLTIPRSVGYEQNPLSLYYCYNLEGSTQYLNKCIAEVTNTPWGERVTFVFNPNTDLVAKPLHVSPFMDMLGNWSIRASVPGENLHVAISVQHPELGNYFSATLKAKRVSLLMKSDPAMFFWLMPHKVALWIYWHAFKLWWKNVSFVQHPRYTNPTYKREAVVRDQKLQCCQSVGWDNDSHLKVGESDLKHLAFSNGGNRCFTWRDAKWPWS